MRNSGLKPFGDPKDCNSRQDRPGQISKKNWWHSDNMQNKRQEQEKTGDTLIHAEQKRLTKKDVDWLEHDRPYK